MIFVHYMECPICFNLLWDPIIYAPCGHTFCAKCCQYNKRKPKCDLCQQPIENFSINRIVQEQISDTCYTDLWLRDKPQVLLKLTVPYTTTLRGLYSLAMKKVDVPENYIENFRLRFQGYNVPPDPNATIRCIGLEKDSTLDTYLVLRGD